MITNARVQDLKKDTDFRWVTALRNTDIPALAEDNGPLQMSLFDQQNLAEITHPKYPHERLIACRNPALNLVDGARAFLAPDLATPRIRTHVLSQQ